MPLPVCTCFERSMSVPGSLFSFFGGSDAAVMAFACCKKMGAGKHLLYLVRFLNRHIRDGCQCFGK
jgi:hypothetical protein